MQTHSGWVGEMVCLCFPGEMMWDGMWELMSAIVNRARGTHIGLIRQTHAIPGTYTTTSQTPTEMECYVRIKL